MFAPLFPFTETANVNGSRKYLHVQMPNDEINLMRGTIDQIKEELHEERSRVDALKACLEQEREKYESNYVTCLKKIGSLHTVIFNYTKKL